MEDDQSVFIISVEDTGPGLEKGREKELFAPYQQGDTSSSRLHEGLGLGLSLSQMLVDIMGGTIHLKGREKRGTEVTLRLPLKLDAEFKRMPSDSLEELAGRRVLFVDDHPLYRRIFSEQLQECNFESLELASGAEEGLELVQRAISAGRPHDLIVLDFNMPRVDGRSCAEKLREAHPHHPFRLMLLSSSAAKGDAEIMKEAGFIAYLLKPCPPSVLREALAFMIATPEDKLGETFITRHRIREHRPDEKGKPRHLHLAKRVLIAEDSKPNRKLLTKTLHKMGCTVTVCRDGQEAAQHFEKPEGRFDLVLMDCEMPILDGYDATRAIRNSSHPQASSLPIVAVTANTSDAAIEKCLECGMNDSLAKPINFIKLYSSIRKWSQPLKPLPPESDHSVPSTLFTVGMVARSLNLPVLETHSLLAEFHVDLRIWQESYAEGDEPNLSNDFLFSVKNLQESSMFFGFNSIGNASGDAVLALRAHQTQMTEQSRRDAMAKLAELRLILVAFERDNDTTLKSIAQKKR